MPEAAIHKHGHPFTPKDEIRLTGEVLVATPPGNAIGSED